MRIIDADELVRQMKTNLIGIIESQATVTDYKAKEERIANLEKNLEEERNHSKYLYDKSQRLEGVIDALEFAVKCNGVSGPEVTLMRA